MLIAALAWTALASTTSLAEPVGAPARQPMDVVRAPARAVALRSELQRATGGTATIALRASTDAATFVGSAAGRPLAPPPGDDVDVDIDDDDDISAIGRRFVDRYGAIFGVVAPEDDLVESQVVELVDGDGRNAGGAVRYQQTKAGVPVVGAQLAVQIDQTGAVLSSTGEATAVIDIGVTPTVDPDVVTRQALAFTAREDGVDPASLTVDAPELWIYDPTLIGADDVLGTRLVWRTNAHNEIGDVNRMFLVDAHEGTLALQFSTTARAKNIRVCNNSGTAVFPCTVGASVRTTPQGSVGSTEVNSAFELAGVTYDFYAGLGRDSLDGAGMQIVSTVNYSPNGGLYKNAFWSGGPTGQMVYGAGYASADDVVAHELTHGVTEFTAGLFYFSESGAINESISDVMGELVDQSSTVSGPDNIADAWKIGEQIPGGAIRSMKRPGDFADPDRMASPLFVGGLADDRGVHTNSGVNNKAAYLMTDGTAGEPGGAFNGQMITGLGVAKTARIYYQAMTTLLGPGSDYLDLGRILPQACTNLVGVGGFGITADDCGQVGKVVLATEMNLRPVTAGAFLGNVPQCVSGVRSSTLFVDDMESNTANWNATTTGNGALWEYFTGSSQSGERSIRVIDRTGPTGTSVLTQSTSVVLPANAFLRFDHAFQFDLPNGTAYDGGLVQFSTNNGASWTSITALAGTVNGHNATLAASNALATAGTAVFGTTSPSYQTTRVSLSTLAGQSVKFRFGLGVDNSVDFDYEGWFLDDVAVYSCAAVASAPGTPTAVTASGGVGAATVSWTAPALDNGAAITSYRITPQLGGALLPPVDTTTTTTPISISVPALTAGSYSFTVAAINSIGVGTQSVPSNTTAVITLPGVPLQAAALAAIAGASITWAAATSNGNSAITGYTVTPFIGAAPQPAVSAGPAATSVAVIGLSTSATYTFTVSALNGAGAGPPAATGPVTPLRDYVPMTPARLLETRTDGTTIDGQSNAIGIRPAGTTTELQITGRAGTPTDAIAAVINIAVTGSTQPGFITVFPCGTQRPTAANLNHTAGQTIANLVTTGIGTNGKICIYTLNDTHIIADLNGYHPG